MDGADLHGAEHVLGGAWARYLETREARQLDDAHCLRNGIAFARDGLVKCRPAQGQRRLCFCLGLAPREPHGAAVERVRVALVVRPHPRTSADHVLHDLPGTLADHVERVVVTGLERPCETDRRRLGARSPEAVAVRRVAVAEEQAELAYLVAGRCQLVGQVAARSPEHGPHGRALDVVLHLDQHDAHSDHLPTHGPERS